AHVRNETVVSHKWISDGSEAAPGLTSSWFASGPSSAFRTCPQLMPHSRSPVHMIKNRDARRVGNDTMASLLTRLVYPNRSRRAPGAIERITRWRRLIIREGPAVRGGTARGI